MFKFGCTQCGQSFEVEAPDSTYKELRLQPCEDNEGDPQHNFEQLYECGNCNFQNVRYWCRGHVLFSSSDGSTSNTNHKSTKYTKGFR
jgi:hypothetical protein